MRLGDGVDYGDCVLEFLEGEEVEERVKDLLSKEVLDEEEGIMLRRVAMCRSVTELDPTVGTCT